MSRDDMVILRCSGCRRELEVERLEEDHPKAALVLVNGCDQCERNNGGFEEVLYFDADGNELGDPTEADDDEAAKERT